MRFSIVVLVSTVWYYGVNSVNNNVCTTYEDYATLKNNTNCWYDIAADVNATEVIKHYGYPLEIHKVTTADGYILSLFRIPNNNVSSNKGPVFLQHGLLSTAALFLALGKNSLAFVLSDAGYDVWLGNYRGNEYSEMHVNLTVDDKKFWDYSFDEIGLYDIPAVLEFIAEKTGQEGKIVYIGHSLGTTVGLVYGIELSEHAKKMVKLFILMSPAAPINNMVSPYRFVAPYLQYLLEIVNSSGLIRPASQAKIQRSLIRSICLRSPILIQSCQIALELFYGTPSRTGPEMIPVLFNQFPGGTSFKTATHIADAITNPFRRYNYGTKKNIEKYGDKNTPEYNFTRIQVPVFIMYSKQDWTCSKKDTLILYKKLPAQTKIYGLHEVTASNFNHIDFVIGKGAKSFVYDHIINLLDKIKLR